MLKLSIMTEHELNQIFGTLDSLIPLHEGEHEVNVFSSVCVSVSPISRYKYLFIQNENEKLRNGTQQHQIRTQSNGNGTISQS